MSTFEPYRRILAESPAARALLVRMMEMRMEALRLYRPLPHAEAFHACTARWKILLGSNRSGKTLAGLADACRCWLGCDPHNKYRPTNGHSLVVGLDQDHIGMLWNKCSESGAFRIILDEHTKEWRAVRPDPMNPRVLDPYDLAYREKWRDAPPLIPPRAIAKVSWEKTAGDRVPRMVRFNTGWTVLWRPSGGPAPRSEAWDHALIDEHISNSDFYWELVRGLTGVGSGYQSSACWSATPQRQNYLLWDLCKAEENGARHVKSFFFSIEDSPYVDEGERRILFDSLSDDEQRRVRYYGQHALAGWKIYPRFEPMGVHGCEPFEIPETWTKYLALDPGTTHCATVFGAVDPEQRHLWIYDQLLLHNSGADDWASHIAERPDAKNFYAWVIDSQAGQQRGMAGYQTFATQYFLAAKRRGVLPMTTGTMAGFIPGCPDPAARREAMSGKLWVRDAGPLAGTAELQVFRGMCPDVTSQIQRSQFDAKNPAKRVFGAFDVLDALEYLVAYNPTYSVGFSRRNSDPIYRAFQDLRAHDDATGSNLCTAMEIN